MDNTPIIRNRNVAEPRVFITKWQPEIDKKVKRKKAFSRERDSKRGCNFEDNDDYDYDYEPAYNKKVIDSEQFTREFDGEHGVLYKDPFYNSRSYHIVYYEHIITYLNGDLYGDLYQIL